MARFMRIPLTAATAFLTFMLVITEGQGQNWGQKVKCFVLQGTVVCPGCNVRQGLFCPKRPEDKPEFDSCEEPTTPPTTQPPEEPTTTTTEPPQYTTEMEDAQIKRTHLLLYLYRYIGPYRSFRRLRRSVKTADDTSEDDTVEDDTCRWNGDCPCPLICCQQGRGCPMRCVVGIRLPPHIYPG